MLCPLLVNGESNDHINTKKTKFAGTMRWFSKVNINA